MNREPDHYDDDFVAPRNSDEIEGHEIVEGLCSLTLFNDTYLRMQGHNLAIVDQFIMQIEDHVRHRLMEEDRTPIDDAMFLNAQSQMWIFALYEILRTWKQQANNILKWHPNNMIPEMIARLRTPDGAFRHFGRERRAEQLEAVLADPSIIDKLRNDLSRIHVPFAQLDMLRVTLAKHENKGKKNSVALAPGYARIDRLTGSLQYELGADRVILAYLSRREIADSIRAFPNAAIPDAAMLASFDEFMKADFGPLDDDEGDY
ncbi:hypothetical protein [Novosphingobium sp.]|uniref:hypothetical protein n=1 Tax=Novosphingobium sp. TaxID=1874826 RepID=UPI0035B46F64